MELLRQVSSVLAVFALLGLALWTLRRGGFASLRGMRRETKSLHCIERLPLTQQHALHLVSIRGREMLVATHPQGCALLMETSEGVRP